MRFYWHSAWDIAVEWGPWSCWRQGHGWIGCLRQPKHSYSPKDRP